MILYEADKKECEKTSQVYVREHILLLEMESLFKYQFQFHVKSSSKTFHAIKGFLFSPLTIPALYKSLFLIRPIWREHFKQIVNKI